MSEQSYFDERMDLLGISAEQNRINVWQYNTETKINELAPVPVFKESDKGIDIFVTTIDRELITYNREGSRWKNKPYCITRLQEPIKKENGDKIKYLIPKGQGSYPFFPPVIIDKYDKKETIDTLYLVEGFFKAFKGAMHGIDIVGLSSITHMKEKDKGILHGDILKLIIACNVKKIVWLTDGDCLDITSKDLTDQIDLYKRPKGFFTSIETFKTLLDDQKDIEKWFMHIDIDAIRERNKEITRDEVKGLDDLLVKFPEKVKEIVDDIYSFSKNSSYFQKFNITYGLNKVYNYFHLGNVKDFYLFHVDRRPEMKEKEFKFVGTIYKYNEQNSECEVIIPQASKDYFRVGDTYYKFVRIPNKYGQLELSFRTRQKGTILDDHGRKFITYIPKYEAFCNTPDHTNFQQIISQNFNIYNPLEHQPENEPCTEDDCPTIIKFIEHIFGGHEVEVTSYKAGTAADKVKKVKYRELGLDYIQLLFKNPTQKGPILCLVSKENETGKSTFAMLLKNIFTANVAIVGNADLADNFNAHWASKLLIICDETKIDKQSVVEKVKSLSTADKIMMNAKGKDHVELDFFGKFMFLTNNEENFIYASDEDLRYWVIKVPKIKDKNPNLMEQMMEEIPAFLSFLNNRTLVTEKVTRMWFDPALLKTEALKKVIEHSKPTIEKELRQYFKEMFLDFGVEEILMCRQDIHKEVFNNRFEANYLEAVLKDKIGVEPYHEWFVNGKYFKTQEEAQDSIVNPTTIVTPEKKTKTVRYTYPRWEEKFNDGKNERVRCDVARIGRPYVLRRKDFVKDEEWASVIQSDETTYINGMTPSINGVPANNSRDELPF